MAETPGIEDNRETPLERGFAVELCHAVNDAIFVHDPETGEILDVNETMCEMYGYSRKEARQLTVEDLSSGTPPYTQAKAVEYVQKAAAGEPQVFEWPAKDSEGDIFWVEISMRRAFLDEDMFILVIVRDISERKAREQELEEQRDKLEILNEVVRHDIRNDLHLVTAHAELLEDHVDEDGKDHLETVQESASNAIDLTMTARNLSEVMLHLDGETEHVNLSSVLPEQLEETRTSFSSADITVEGTIPRMAVEADEMLGSVFRNLLYNAVQHNYKEQPEVTVTVERIRDSLEVRIADNGCGIPDSQKEEIFEKGINRLESGKTGIGLYLVKSLMDAYGGDVWVEDNDPEGTVFVVQLPVVE
jgi:PAS domain S-box-containing protein